MTTLALDIGGANLKAAHRNGACRSIPFALWREPKQLTAKLHSLGFDFDRLLVTITGELCDCFVSRDEGVRFIVDAVRDFAAAREAAVWSMGEGFVSLDEASDKPLAVASANWHALATWVARTFPAERGVLVDVGSTTTDVIAFSNDVIPAQTDAQRLAAGSLLYLGARRTSLMAVSADVPLMAEHFATTADVYVLLDHLPEDKADCDTADGRPLTKRFAANRVLRMIGADIDMATMDDAVAMAKRFHERITARIDMAIKQHNASRVIVSGSGAFLVEKHATDDLRKTLSDGAATAACAYALLQLDESA